MNRFPAYLQPVRSHGASNGTSGGTDLHSSMKVLPAAQNLPPGVPTGPIVQSGAQITPVFIATTLGILVLVGSLAYYLTRVAPERPAERIRVRRRRNPWGEPSSRPRILTPTETLVREQWIADEERRLREEFAKPYEATSDDEALEEYRHRRRPARRSTRHR